MDSYRIEPIQRAWCFRFQPMSVGGQRKFNRRVAELFLHVDGTDIIRQQN
jgi:hypothetical protein